MGFKEARKRLIECLINMNFKIYADRPNIKIKNKLYAKEVNAEFVLGKIIKCRGHDHKAESGYSDADDNCMHVFKIDGWYIKYFLLNNVVYFVSVHKDDSDV